MKNFLYPVSIILIMFSACSNQNSSSTIRSLEPPVEKALDYNFDLNQAKSIVNYTTKHKKARQKLANQNRELQNDNWIRLNSNNKDTEKRNSGGAFKFYKNN